MNRQRAARLARGWALAAFATLVSALVHVLAGGDMPGLLPIALALVVGGALSTALVGRRLSLWRLSLGVFASQTIMHGLFSLGVGPVLGAASGAAGLHAGHGSSPASLLGGTQFSLATVTGTAHGYFDHDAAMLLGHAVAALTTIAAVLYGAQAVRALGSAAQMLLARVLRPHISLPMLPDAAHARAAAASVVRPSLSGVYLSVMRHRGPPVLALSH